MLADLRAGKFDRVVVWTEDRLHRQPAEMEALISAAGSAGVDLTSVKGGDTDLSPDGEGLVLVRVKGAIAAEEVRKTRIRIKAQKLELAKTGKDNGGGRPFGCGVDRVTILEPEAKLIREAATAVLDGATPYAVAADWNRRGIPTVYSGSTGRFGRLGR